VKKNSVLLEQTIFAKQETNKAQQQNDRRVIKATKEISMQHLITRGCVDDGPLRADHRRLSNMLGGTDIGRPNDPAPT
jgi:hypothetical protein